MPPGLWALTLALWIAARAQAADPQSYTVTIHDTGNSALDTALHASSQLESLRKGAPVGPFALIGRAQDDGERLATVIESFGYYRRALTITIDGKALDDPRLADALAALPKDHTAKVEVTIELGPLYQLRKITIDGDISAAARSAMQLETGAPAVAANVLAARERLLNTLEEEGHAFAKVEEPIAYEDRSDPVLDLEFKVEAGPQVHIGAILLTGMTRTHEAFVRKRLLLHSGEQYSPSRIERARTDLLALGVFSGVSVHPATELDPAGRLPITFELKERKLHAVTLNAAYSSDLGGSAGATWSNRNLFGNAEQLNLTASAINLGGNATTGLGYDFAAQLIKPDFLARDQSLQFSAAALKQDLIAYQQTATTLGASLNRKLSSAWTVSVGLGLEEETIVQEPATCVPIPGTPPPTGEQLTMDCKPGPLYYTLVSLPISGKYDSTEVANPLADPLHGIRATLTVTPTESLGAGHSVTANGSTTAAADATFVIIQSTISTYFDLERFGWTQRGRSVIALRALGGLAVGADSFSLPPDQRFYGGGSLTIRGYPYQGVGPVFLDRNPIGGTAIEAVGAELRQRFGQNFGAVFFVDAGEVTATTRPFQGTLSLGFGTGLRYYTPIGPIRLDVGFPGAHPGGRGYPFVEIYVGLGQVF
ncbi:MAG TPA: BamA/TamA family outer membrane protein [Steroidobacteraceae bacterium]|jgi:translocation and assembly module TamA|nr:BamA/TamA family outer membrane protein [Steroidobacteraceae bacterium]